MKITIDGSNAVLGRLASYAAREALRGDEVVVLNCEKIIITGSKKDIEDDFKAKRGRVGTVQKGPKQPRTSDKIVKRVIRGMLPNHRFGRGRVAYSKIRCYTGVPKEFEGVKTIKVGQEKRNKFIHVKDISK
ncbi:MAG: 50S ribosomal protein L13 [Nanoarchaeota archaeon]